MTTKEQILEYFKDVNKYYNDCTRYDELKRMLNELTIRPKGHWIEGKYKDTDIRYNETSYKCSRCGEIVDFEKPTCPNCTADMRESEDEE